ncbi:MAG: glutaredoxin domain-containing protein [Vicingaceae bacterium]|jgi:glutaredoxin
MYTLFTADNCTQCAQVETFLNKSNVTFRIVNVDTSDDRPPIQIFAFPVLFSGDQLLGYGTDIKDYIKKKSPTS